MLWKSATSLRLLCRYLACESEPTALSCKRNVVVSYLPHPSWGPKKSKNNSNYHPKDVTKHFYPPQWQPSSDNESIEEIRVRIFGDSCKYMERTGRRILAKELKGKEMAEWYINAPKFTPGFHSEEKEQLERSKLNKRQKAPKEEEPQTTQKKKKKK